MISVCMATYNGERFLREQIDSILSQLGEGDELVISDDGSTDNTINIINSYDDKRIKLFFNEESHGVVGNFENALKNSNGDIIFLSDQDDVWLDYKVSVFVDSFKNNGSDVLLSDCMITDSNLNVLTQSKFSLDKVGVGVIKNIVKCGYLGSCMAFKRECMYLFMPIPKNKYILHDIWIGLTLGSIRKIGLIHTPTMLYRRHESAVTPTHFQLINTSRANNNSLSYKIIKRIVLLYEYIKWRFAD